MNTLKKQIILNELKKIPNINHDNLATALIENDNIATRDFVHSEIKELRSEMKNEIRNSSIGIVFIIIVTSFLEKLL